MLPMECIAGWGLGLSACETLEHLEPYRDRKPILHQLPGRLAPSAGMAGARGGAGDLR